MIEYRADKQTSLYFAWKKAINFEYGNSFTYNRTGLDMVMYETYGCLCIKRHFKEGTNFLTSVILAFDSEQDHLMFLLRWT